VYKNVHLTWVTWRWWMNEWTKLTRFNLKFWRTQKKFTKKQKKYLNHSRRKIKEKIQAKSVQLRETHSMNECRQDWHWKPKTVLLLLAKWLIDLNWELLLNYWKIPIKTFSESHNWSPKLTSPFTPCTMSRTSGNSLLRASLHFDVISSQNIS
jgi:hypothetical protein